MRRITIRRKKEGGPWPAHNTGSPTEAGYTPVETPGWEVATSADQGLDPRLVSDLYRDAAQLPNLYGLLIVKNGEIVAEQYFNGSTVDTKRPTASVTKSYVSALVGKFIASIPKQ